MNLVFATLPLLLTLAAGYLLSATKALPREQWAGVEILSFRLLIPAFLVRAIAGADLSGAAIGPFALTLVAAVTLGGVIVLALRPAISHARLPNPSFTTLFQSTTRFNGFIALAAAALLHGHDGVVLTAVAMAVLIPLINIANIIVMAAFGSAQTSLRGVVLNVLRNPLIQGSLLGLALNVTGTPLPVAIDTALDMIGRAALGVGVLVVGAGISLRRLARPAPAVLAGLLLHPGLGLLLFLSMASLLGLPGEQRMIGALLFASPAATNGYIVARQMGGNAELYADILTFQTLLTLALLPLIATFLSP